MSVQAVRRVTGGDGLKGKLQRLANPPSEVADGWRRISGAKAVIAEIDETVLPRRLSFRSAGGEILSLEAGQRRLRRLLPPAPEALADHAALFEAARLDPEADLPGVGAILARHFGGDGDVWVFSDPLPEAAGGAPTGLSAAMIAEAWDTAGNGAVPEPVDPAEAVDEFLDLLARRSGTWVVLGDGAVEAQSDGADDLAARAPALWRAVAGDRATAEPVCCVLGRSGDASGCLVLAGDDERAIVARTTGAGAGEIAALWRGVWTG